MKKILLFFAILAWSFQAFAESIDMYDIYDNYEKFTEYKFKKYFKFIKGKRILCGGKIEDVSKVMFTNIIGCKVLVPLENKDNFEIIFEVSERAANKLEKGKSLLFEGTIFRINDWNGILTLSLRKVTLIKQE